MTIEKLDATTPDLTRQNIARLAELFPECVTEGPTGSASDQGEPVIDFDLLRQALADHLVEGPQERYRLDWPGKRQALLTANAPIDKTLRPMRADSVDFDTTRNLFIEGDNLDALKLLQETYLGKVKMIYIDPPYNTGKDFIYKDNFSQRREAYETGSGQRDQEGSRLVANPETNGRFHSDWLSMMYPRLKLARNLLRDDGVIFISIDDTEVANLRALCDAIFGQDNFHANIVWQKTYSPANDKRGIDAMHDHILCYVKSDIYNINLLGRGEKQDRAYVNPDNDPRGPWKAVDATRAEHRDYAFYPITTPSGADVWPAKGRSWAMNKEDVPALIADGRLWFGQNGSSKPSRKLFLTDVKQGVTPTSWWPHEEVGHNDESKKDIKSLFDGAAVFQTPKPVRLLQRIVALSTNNDDIVLDFFAGSSTTAHAIMKQDAEDGGKRRSILVQLPESIDPESDIGRSGYHDISELSRERIRRAGTKILADSPNLKGELDVGFRAFRIDSSNFQDTRVAPDQATQATLDGLISHIKDERTDEDLLFGALVRWGVDITLPIRRDELLGRTIWTVDPPAELEGGAALIACFERPQNAEGGIDTELADALAAMKPLRVLFRDDGFASDAAKENVASRFKQSAPDTAVKVL